jgi:hypothetical protein
MAKLSRILPWGSSSWSIDWETRREVHFYKSKPGLLIWGFGDWIFIDTEKSSRQIQKERLRKYAPMIFRKLTFGYVPDHDLRLSEDDLAVGGSTWWLQARKIKEVVRMAQIAAQAQQNLHEQGIYVRECCDRLGCGHIIGPVSFTGKAGRVYCSRACHDVQEQPTKLKEKKSAVDVQPETVVEEKRAPVPRVDRADKFMGIVMPGTTIAKMLEVLLDGKWHSTESMKAVRVKEDDSIGWRLTMLEQKGANADRPFKLEILDDKAKLIFLSGDAPKSVVKVMDVPVEEE